jgi:mono/diheme cytochrome c family protein
LLKFCEQVLQERAKMKKLLAIASIFIFGILLIIMLDACTVFQRRVGTRRREGAFDSNGERIYITATSERYARITYSGGPPSGMMMGGGNLACASCHAPDAQGELHTMMGMQIVDAPDIRWVSIAGEVDEGHGEEEEGHGGEEEGHGEEGYDLDLFRMAVVEGKHPNGEPFSVDMPRWNINDEDLEDMVEFLMSLD